MWTITSTQDEASWFDDYLSQIISSTTPKLPQHEGSFGETEWFWYSPNPGYYYLQTNGGTINDRVITSNYIVGQLENFGLKLAAPNFFDQDREQVAAKALRLIRAGQVQVHDNNIGEITGTVQGDHGTYQPWIQRNTQAIESGQVSPKDQNSILTSGCQCSWGDYQNTPRTRQWKQYQNQACAHLVALWWQAQQIPIEGYNDQQQRPQGPWNPQQFQNLQQNPMQNFGPMAPGPQLTPGPGPDTTQRTFGPEEAEGFSPAQEDFNPQDLQVPQMNMQPGAPPPNPESALPQAPPEQIPIDPDGSVPGKKPQTPSNPIQYPGGTYSKISAEAFNEGDMVQLKNDDWATGVGNPGYAGVGQPIQIPAGTIGEVRHVDPTTGMLEVFYNQGPFLQNKEMTAHGGTAFHFPSELQRRPDLRGNSPMIRRT